MTKTLVVTGKEQEQTLTHKPDVVAHTQAQLFGGRLEENSIAAWSVHNTTRERNMEKKKGWWGRKGQEILYQELNIQLVIYRTVSNGIVKAALSSISWH